MILKMNPIPVLSHLCCPICRSDLSLVDSKFLCSGATCGIAHPILAGNIPVLLNEKKSLFSARDYQPGGNSTISISPHASRLKDFYRKYLIPSLGTSLNVDQHLNYFIQLLLEKNPRPLVLIVGGQTTGADFEVLKQFPQVQLIETDVGVGPRTRMICDAHDLPFKERTFDGVIAQAVLEHVADPQRCVDEMHRTLKDDGLVYAETPFMQQVHLGKYDFTRFTYLGYLRLFRNFSKVEGGVLCGPGMALAWAYSYFVLSFFKGRFTRAVARLFCRYTSFFWKYFDGYLSKRDEAFDAASAFYYLGKKSAETLTDREIIKAYRGGI